MKNIILLAASAVFVVTISSCSKDYVCKCEGEADLEYSDQGAAEAKVQETACTAEPGCTWEEN